VNPKPLNKYLLLKRNVYVFCANGFQEPLNTMKVHVMVQEKVFVEGLWVHGIS
jgi:hypothetical protein